MKKKYFNGYYALRWKILQRDNFTCQYCGQKAPGVILEVDHIIPVGEGGTSEEANLITACSACNIGKSALSIVAKRTGQRPTATYTAPTTGGNHRFRQDEVYQFIKKQDGISSDQIAKHFNISHNNAHQIVGRLGKRGLIKKVWNAKGCSIYAK